MSYVEVGCRVLLGVVFVWSAASKLRSRADVAEFVRSLRPLTRRPTAAAVALLVAEVAVPPLLLFAPGWGLTVACGLLAVLSYGVITIIRRRLAVRCRCFGTGEQLGVPHLVRNLLLLGIGAVGLVATALPADTSPHGPGVLLAAGAAAILGTLIIRFYDIVDLFQ